MCWVWRWLAVRAAARPDEAAMAVGFACWLAAAGGRAARIGSRPGVAQRKTEGRKRPAL